jgi:hypothetical protein
MRVLRMVGVAGAALVCGVPSLWAQHAHQLEIGGFGTYTWFDPMWNLKQGADAIGFGGRLGFFFNEYFGLEVAAGQTKGKAEVGTQTTNVRPGDVSLIINSGGEHNVLYVMLGYSRLSMGDSAPYAFGFNAAHGGIGDRIFFGNHVALRLEGGVYYDLTTQPGIPTRPLNYQANAGLSFFLGGSGGGGRHHEEPEITPEKRDSLVAAGATVPPEKPTKQRYVETGTNWSRQWFWGGQAGLMLFDTYSDGFSAEPIFGGHWLITAKKTALYVGYDQAFFVADRHATIIEPNGTIEADNIAFNSLRRIMFGALAFPVQKAMQPFVGGGFAIMQVINPTATCTNCTLSDFVLTQNAAENAASSAFFWVMGGIDIRQGRLSLYGHYIVTTPSRTFLINGNTHTFQGGLRYSLGSSREDVSQEH